jgi:hypothetical protein
MRPIARLQVGMASVECANPDGECKIVGGLIGGKFEILDRNRAQAQTAGADQIRPRSAQLRDRCGGPIDREHAPRRSDSVGDFDRGCTWPAPDLDHTETGCEGKCVDDLTQAC